MQTVYTSFEKKDGEIFAIQEGETGLIKVPVSELKDYEDYLKDEISKAEKAMRYFNGNDTISIAKHEKYTLYLSRLQGVMH